jgi:hypothetical protein
MCRERRRLDARGEDELGVTCSVGACEKGMGERDLEVERDDISEWAEGGFADG